LTTSDLRTALRDAAISALTYCVPASLEESADVALDAAFRRLGQPDVQELVRRTIRETPTPPKPGAHDTFCGPVADAVLVALGATVKEPWDVPRDD
jgi:hypothetical protein